MTNILAENLQRNLHQIILVLNKHLDSRRGGSVSDSLVICEDPYWFVLNKITTSRENRKWWLNFVCSGSKEYNINEALKYDLSDQDREYAAFKFGCILDKSIFHKLQLNQDARVKFQRARTYYWPIPSMKEYESKRLNITDLLIEQVVPEIMELHKIFAKEVAEKDRQVEELMNEFHLFYKWSKEDPVPKFEPKIQNMIASHKLYPSIKHVKEVWGETSCSTT